MTGNDPFRWPESVLLNALSEMTICFRTTPRELHRAGKQTWKILLGVSNLFAQASLNLFPGDQ